MSEARMIEAVNAALSSHHIDDEVRTAGQFNPRGTTGAMFAGGLAGDAVGAGSALDAATTVGGSVLGRRAASYYRNLPEWMLVGVSDEWIYGFAGRSRRREPGRLVFRLPRKGLRVRVGQRVNVRTLSLSTGDDHPIELEGNRLPLTHSRDVIAALA
jgi:hypothetical protein